MKKLLSAVLIAAMVTTGCASAGAPRVQTAAPVVDQAVLADYVQKLPVGSRIRVDQIGGKSFKGTLMKATNASIVVQKNTRIPESPIEIPLRELTRVALDDGSHVGRSVGIGVAVGVAATFGVLLLLAALIGD